MNYRITTESGEALMALTASPADQALLLDIQAIDTKIAQLEHKAKSLTQHSVIAALVTQISALRIVELERRGAREDVQIELGRLESDVAVVEARIARDTERMQISTSAKDAQAFEHELQLLAKRQFDLEEIEITVMERLEERDTELAEITARIDDLVAQVGAVEGERDAELAGIDAELKHSGANRSTIASKVPGELLALYEKQRARYGTGASLLRFGVSSANGVKLLENEMQAIRQAAPDAVIMCASSEAILVRTGESGL
ncbi:MAG: zinc ribbon domain-containing protein [Microbacteriaceae bacterium]